MYTAAEAEVATRFARDVVHIGVAELPLVAIGGPIREADVVARPHGAAVQRDILLQTAPEALRRGVEAQRFLDCIGKECRIGHHASACWMLLGHIKGKHGHEPAERLYACHDQRRGCEQHFPLVESVAAISVGIIDGVPMLDLAYTEDSRAETDMNVVVTGDGRFVEVQGTAEGVPFRRDELDALLDLAVAGCLQLNEFQQEALVG